MADAVVPRTAELADSWLVLYNTGDAESAEWATWFCAQRGIPADNVVGLTTSSDEHLADRDEVEDQIIGPVRGLLDGDPDLQDKIMGIIVGYGVPGTFGTAPAGGPGGYSVADALVDMYDDEDTSQKDDNQDCPLFYGQTLPPARLTRETMLSDPYPQYMVARIDAPTLEAAKDLTRRAIAIENEFTYLYGDNIWYDYLDGSLPSGEWFWLKRAVTMPEMEEEPWSEFDADSDPTHHDALRFGTHDTNGWDDGRLESDSPGWRILAYNFNSWGATTVRSTSAEGGRYVPNALAAGYAAAIGATGEPYCCVAPFPEVLVASLRQGWTLGESFYLANPYNDWMWTLVGDPFLQIEHWFDDDPEPGDGDMNGDGVVNGLDIALFSQTLLDPSPPGEMQAIADLNGDGRLNDDDLFIMSAPLLFDTTDPDVLRGHGDANGDGRHDGQDIAALIDMLLYGTYGWSLRQSYGADVTKDDLITWEDVPVFVERLISGDWALDNAS